MTESDKKIYNKNRHKYQYIKNREFRQFSLNLSKFFFLKFLFIDCRGKMARWLLADENQPGFV